jgi:predicted mannosyl-3-phosphoglycerate phosphatase (HAD superfamily)
MITEQDKISQSFYQKGEMRIEDGIIMNELGKPAKKGDIVLRHPETGYPLKRFGDSEPVDIDLKTGKPIKKVN